jgi:hypothetical protein
MNTWTPKLREKAYILCRDRDGEKCNGSCGGRVPANPVKDPLREVPYLTVDHIDGDSSHNPTDGSNWQLLCQSCNNKKRKMPTKKTRSIDKFPRYKEYCASLREGVGTREYAGKITREMEKNDEAELVFRRFVEDILEEFGEMKESELLNSGAMNHFLVYKRKKNISQEALRRYLHKWTSPVNGDMERFPIDHPTHIRLNNTKIIGAKP